LLGADWENWEPPEEEPGGAEVGPTALEQLLQVCQDIADVDVSGADSEAVIRILEGHKLIMRGALERYRNEEGNEVGEADSNDRGVPAG